VSKKHLPLRSEDHLQRFRQDAKGHGRSRHDLTVDLDAALGFTFRGQLGRVETGHELFEAGMLADIQPPDPETKIAILKRKALDRKCPVPDEVLEFLAKDSGHDVRMLEGRLTKVIFASKLHEEPITLDLARKALNESVNESEAQEDITPEKILSAVCGYFKQKKEDILGKGKKADLVSARQICAYLMCEMLSLPLVSIGKILGGRDHTTIMYARDKMEKLVSLNDHIAKQVDDIKNIVLKK